MTTDWVQQHQPTTGIGRQPDSTLVPRDILFGSALTDNQPMAFATEALGSRSDATAKIYLAHLGALSARPVQNKVTQNRDCKGFHGGDDEASRSLSPV